MTDDQEIDLAPTAPRFDLSASGDIAQEKPAARLAGPRQRRFEFDAKIIRDTVVRKLKSIDRYDLAETMDGCHREAVFKRCTGCHSVKTFYNRCETFCCPICAARLARDRRESVDFWSKVVGQPKHLVLTVKSVPTLTRGYIRQLKADLTNLRKQAWAHSGARKAIACVCPWSKGNNWHDWRKLFPKYIWIEVEQGIVYRCTKKWLGGFWSIDGTYNEPVAIGDIRTVSGKTYTAARESTGGWHIHFHIAVDSQWIDNEWLAERWAAIRGQAHSVCEVIDVKGTDYTAEICRYVTDGVSLGNWPAKQLEEFITALSDERCFGTFGALYKQRAEWTAFKETLNAERAVCECGCSKWEFFDENEWEAAHCRGGIPPPSSQPARPTFHPELLPPVFYGVK